MTDPNPDTATLIERLLRRFEFHEDMGPGLVRDCNEAAAALSEQAARIEKLEAILRELVRLNDLCSAQSMEPSVWRDRVDEYARCSPIAWSAARSLSTKAGNETRAEAKQAKCILACRDAIATDDYAEAWHQLYALQETFPGCDEYKPWEHLEALAAKEQ